MGRNGTVTDVTNCLSDAIEVPIKRLQALASRMIIANEILLKYCYSYADTYYTAIEFFYKLLSIIG